MLTILARMVLFLLDGVSVIGLLIFCTFQFSQETFLTCLSDIQNIYESHHRSRSFGKINAFTPIFVAVIQASSHFLTQV